MGNRKWKKGIRFRGQYRRQEDLRKGTRDKSKGKGMRGMANEMGAKRQQEMEEEKVKSKMELGSGNNRL